MWHRPCLCAKAVLRHDADRDRVHSGARVRLILYGDLALADARESRHNEREVAQGLIGAECEDGTTFLPGENVAKRDDVAGGNGMPARDTRVARWNLSLIHISEPTR